MEHNYKHTISKGLKTRPDLFIDKGWQYKGDEILLLQDTKAEAATLLIDLDASQDVYFMAEISSLTETPPETALNLAISVNGSLIDNWTIHSRIIYDKLITIPAKLLQISGPAEISFQFEQKADDLLRPNATSAGQGILLHSISVNTDLSPYLDELQTGYNWSCSVRNEAIDNIRNVLYFLTNLPERHPLIEEKLVSLLNDPYIASNHSFPLIFDQNYFNAHYAALKEGDIHQAIRKWVASIQAFNKSVIDIGNYATSQPNSKCYDTGELRRFAPNIDYSEKIAKLRKLNEEVNNLEIILQKAKITSIPSTLYLDINNTCNFRCKMCYQSKSHFLQTNLTNNHLLAVLQMLPYLKQITVAGLGEPLLSRNLKIFAEAAGKLRCQISIITNGSLIHKNLDTLKRFSSVSISFDSANAVTFETIRNRSKFNQIVKNIKLLRDYAPDLRINFSVVVSRINIDEIAAIATLAGELGVNEINMTPIEHMPLLELKASDKILFDNQLHKANKTAQQYSLKINNSVVPASFAKEEDSPRDKRALLEYLSSLPTKPEPSRKIENLIGNLMAQPFYYYPDPLVFMREDWPPLTTDVTSLKASADLNTNLSKAIPFDPDQEIERLSDRLTNLSGQIKEKSEGFFKMPYCLDPWKLNYVKSTGKSRLCCHADVLTGNLGTDGVKESVNSGKYQKIRASMFDHEDLLLVCQKCKAADRFMGLEALKETIGAFRLCWGDKLS